MSRQSSTQAYTEAYTDQNTCSYVNRNTTIFEALVCIIYLLFILVFNKFYFVVEPEWPIANVPLVRPGWTICWKFLQLIDSIGIPLGTNRETIPPIFMPNQCCISSRLFFTVTTIRPVLQYSTGTQDPSTSGSTPPVSKLQRSPTQKLLEHNSVDNCDFSALQQICDHLVQQFDINHSHYW